MYWETFGHNSVKNILNKQLTSGKFSHAYLFSGPSGVGKKTLALEFSKKILTANKVENHPDFQILDGEAEITSEQILEFIAKLAFKPFFGPKKLAIINNADQLNIQSGNALLKTLEEPSPSTVIILIASSAKLLPTIVSRCQTFSFNSFSEEQLKNYALSTGLKIEPGALSLSFGSITKLKNLTNNVGALERENMKIENYKNIGKMTAGERLLQVGKYAEADTLDLEQNLLTWLNWQSRELKKTPADFTKLQALNGALAGFKMNKNKKLILQNLFLNI